MPKRFLCPLLSVALMGLFAACHSGPGSDAKSGIDTAALFKGLESSPVLSGEESLRKMKLVDGFSIDLLAIEPLVNTPVTMSFDDRGRMWVVEMIGYMPDTTGLGEDVPNGKIVILEDTDGDGKPDKRKLFLDSLVLPRAICFIENGILVAEYPKLWFYEINNDMPGKKTLVDSLYAIGGNPELQANGLVRALDNWIYSARSTRRYRKQGDKWLTDVTQARGQWGVCQDDFGRLFFNNNEVNLQGDYFPPSLGARNPNQRTINGYHIRIVPDDRVYPARPTTGVNRGYMKGLLDSTLRLYQVTSACGPIIYRGGAFGDEYDQNGFSADPAAHVIKRNILESDGYIVNGRQAYEGSEFLTSTDERFRPVTLLNGPDGALYVVDMARGVIQHKTYLTSYLNEEIAKRNLLQPQDCGRIYKIYPTDKKLTVPTIPEDPAQLAAMLGHPNGWIRDRAQQKLVDGKYTQIAATLRSHLRDETKLHLLIHSLWTLEGLGELKADDLLPLLQSQSEKIRIQALTALPAVLNRSNYKTFLPILHNMVSKKDDVVAPYIGFLGHAFYKNDKKATDDLMIALMQGWPDNEYVTSAIAGNLYNREEEFLTLASRKDPDTSRLLYKELANITFEVKSAKEALQAKKYEKIYPEGFAFYKSNCQPCHGAAGQGIRPLGPPLNRSEWVTGDKSRLAAIMLYGVRGPMMVNGKLYETPKFGENMQGFAGNGDVTDELLAGVLSYIRNSWNNSGAPVEAGEVAEIRKKFAGRQEQFTMEELHETNW